MQEIIHSLGIEWKILIAQIVNFAILFFVLRYFAYRPLLKVLRERREGIIRTETDKEKATEILKGAEAKQQEMLDAARREGRTIVEEARASSTYLIEEMRNAAEAERLQRSKDMKEMMLKEKDEIMSKIKSEGAELITRALQQAFGTVLDEQTEKRILEETLSHLRK